MSACEKKAGENQTEMKPVISVIVPVYNAEEYLQQCIESILGQTYKNIEIILVDDGSTDNSRAICDAYAEKDHRIQVIHKQNGGVSSARNTGLAAVHGDYIGWVDADDWIAPQMYEKLLEEIQKNSAAISICGRFVVDSDGHESASGSVSRQVLTSGQAIQLLLQNEIRTYLWDKLFQRDLYNNIVFYEKTAFEDVRVLYKLFERAEKIVSIQEILCYHRELPESISHVRSAKNRTERLDAVISRSTDLWDRWPEFRGLLTKNVYLAGIDVREILCGLSQKEFVCYQDTMKRFSNFLNSNESLYMSTYPVGRMGTLEYRALAYGTQRSLRLSLIASKIMEFYTKASEKFSVG